MMKKVLLIITAFIYTITSFGQILITDLDLDTLNPMPCTGVALPNFFDSGNPGNYNANENETIVICPDYTSSTSKLSLTFGINAGLLFDVDISDTVYIYDGFNTSAPLLGSHNSVTDPNGFNHIASFNNPKGCLTVRFVSDGSIEGTGWEASVNCIQPAQPFDVHMAGYLNGTDIISPSDTGYSDICFGDSILFVATPNFPNSSDISGIGYSQNNNNVIYEWEFSDGTTASTDSVWFKPPARNGYVVSLKIIDSFPLSQSIFSKIRVSTIPNFSGVLITRDNICVGDTTLIIGAVTSSDTSGVDPTSSSFQLGGSVAGQIYLPDGSGLMHQDTINISGFVPGDTVSSITDLEQLCLNMEHSYLGDLEMTLTCPNGTTINIFNSFAGLSGIISGGFSGSGTYLGHPIDDPSGPPGSGEEYCWSSTLNTFSSFPVEYAANNFIALTTPSSPSAGNSMNWNGIYAPEESFINLVGCPLNGDWSITVRDNIGQDDGYIFEWSILFDPVLNPNNETYTPQVVSSQWLSAATILPGLPTDTFIVVSSTTSGPHAYTFEITDNFGCTYDTTVTVNFIELPTITNGNGNTCQGEYQVAGTTSFNGGFWTYSGPGNASFSPNSTTNNPLINVNVNGTYTFTYTDNRCAIDTSMDIYFADSVDVSITGGDFCVGDELIIDATSQVLEASYLWSTGSTNPTIIVADSGIYYVAVSGNCNTSVDSALVTTAICGVSASNIITPNGDGHNDVLFFFGLDRFPNSSLEVFNRWGLLMYESDNYQNNWSPSGVSEGTYFYILTPDVSNGVKQEPLKGSITILK